VQRAARATVHDLGEGFHQVLLRYGFMETPLVPDALADITLADFGFDPEDAVYFIGKESVIPSHRGMVIELRDRLFAVMHRNATSVIRFFGLPPEDVIEVGVQVPM
jgi:KUP system potassium uptake protein